jgi:hypothetical protein
MVTASWEDPAVGLYSISVAAEPAGLHPQLGIYEREGLLEPAYPGATCRHSQNDITRLLEIYAMTGHRLNTVGVRGYSSCKTKPASSGPILPSSEPGVTAPAGRPELTAMPSSK